MALTKQVAIAGAAALCAAGFLTVLGVPAPASAQTAFGQEMPQQYFVNRYTNPQPAAPAAGAAQPSAAGGQAQGAAANADDDDGPGPWPKRYLLNRLLGQ